MIRSRISLRVVAPIVALLALALQTGTASAGITWCRADPGVALNGAEVQIVVSVPDAYQHLVSGPIQVTVKTPEGVEREVLWTDSGFNGFGEEVDFGTVRGSIAPDRSFLVVVQVLVPVGGNTGIPMLVELIVDGSSSAVVQGLTSGISVKTRVWGAY